MKNAQLQKMLAKLPPDAELLINIFDQAIFRKGVKMKWLGNNFSEVTRVELAKSGKPIGGIEVTAVEVGGKVQPVIVIGRSTAFSL